MLDVAETTKIQEKHKCRVHANRVAVCPIYHLSVWSWPSIPTLIMTVPPHFHFNHCHPTPQQALQFPPLAVGLFSSSVSFLIYFYFYFILFSVYNCVLCIFCIFCILCTASPAQPVRIFVTTPSSTRPNTVNLYFSTSRNSSQWRRRTRSPRRPAMTRGRMK